MKKLSDFEMSHLSGGKLTEQEVRDFLGAASCVMAYKSLLSAVGCYRWLRFDVF